MKELKLDIDDDLAFEGGDLVLIDGPDTTAQLIKVRTRLARGELQWDNRVGMTVLLAEDPPGLPQIRAEYRYVLATTPGVKSVTSLDFVFDPDTRTLSIDGEVLGGGPDPITIKETLILGGSA